MNADAKALLGRLGFEMDVDALVAGLTVAEAQFVEIARALVTDLRLLILDEPTSALTPGEAAKLYDVVRRLRGDGTTVVWISHRMEEIRRLADTITVLALVEALSRGGAAMLQPVLALGPLLAGLGSLFKGCGALFGG